MDIKKGKEKRKGRSGYHRLLAVMSVFCSFLILCTLGFNYSFGNVNPYLTSYLRNKTEDGDISYTDTLWIPQAKTITTVFAMPFLGLLSTWIPSKLYLLIGVVAEAGCYFGLYACLQTSFPLTVLTYGILGGLGNAILYPECINIAIRWVPDRKGLVTGLILTGYGLGAVAWNELTTLYINRHNVSPDLVVGEDLYFTQEEVLEQVPDCFFLLAIIYTSVQLVCVLILRPAPSQTEETQVTYTSASTKQGLLKGQQQLQTEDTSFIEKPKSYQATSSEGTLNEGSCSKQHPSEVVQHTTDYNPWEVARSRVMWTLWFMMALTQIATSFVTNFFKAYGQTFVNDDNFLTTVASLSSVFNAVGRPFWGILGDRLGYRMVSLMAQCALCCLLATFISCEWMGRWAFLIWVCCMYLTMTGIFTIIPILVHSAFGSRYFNANIGVVDTNSGVAAFASTALATLLKASVGWHGLYFVGCCSVFLGVLLTMSLSLRCGNSIPRHMRAHLSLSP